jgi:hypothetical protein
MKRMLIRTRKRAKRELTTKLPREGNQASPPSGRKRKTI